jgi:SAM-dependent methyltransferase
MPILSMSQLFLQRRTLESTASLALSLGSLEKDDRTAGAMGALQRRAWAARPRGRSGPGLTTDRLRSTSPRLTAIEADQDLAQLLRARLRGTNVEVVNGDATSMPFPDAEFSGCAAFTMLHHVPSPALQDKLLREVWRVLKPGGAFVGCDSLQSVFMRVLHLGDTFVPIRPDTFGARLEGAGFEVIELEKGPGAFRFYAIKPMRRP